MEPTIKLLFKAGLMLLLINIGYAQYINTTLENVSGTLQCNLTSLQEVYNGADWYEYELSLIELYSNSTAVLRDYTYDYSNTTLNLTLSRLETAFSCQSYVICKGVLWNATSFYLEDGEITEYFESINTSMYVNCTTTSTTSTTTITVTTTVTTLVGLTNYPTWFSAVTTYVNDRPKINISGGTQDTIPTGQGGLGNTTGLGTKILGLDTTKFLSLWVFVLIGFVMLAIGQLNRRFGVLVGNFLLDFCVLIGGWITLSMGVLVMINMIAILYWYGGD
jgi:hypothetical protein